MWIFIAPRPEHTWRSGITCVFKGSQFYLHTPSSSVQPAFSFSAKAGLPTPEAWKAELAWQYAITTLPQTGSKAKDF